MKAVVVNELNDFGVTSVDLDPPKVGEVLVKMKATGICHSDLSIANGTIPSPLPVVLGHEGSGTVVEVGPGTSEYKVGDRVMLPFVSSCGKCGRCKAGHPTLCEVHFTGKRGTLIDGSCRNELGIVVLKDPLSRITRFPLALRPETSAI